MLKTDFARFTRVGQSCDLKKKVFFWKTFRQHQEGRDHGTFQVSHESGPKFSAVILEQNTNLKKIHFSPFFLLCCILYCIKYEAKSTFQMLFILHEIQEVEVNS